MTDTVKHDRGKIEIDANECKGCGLCVRVCKDLMGRGVISMFGRGAARKVRTAFGEPGPLQGSLPHDASDLEVPSVDPPTGK